MSKRTCFIFQPIFPHFSGILAGQRAQRSISLPPVIFSTISSIVLFVYRASHLSCIVHLSCFSSIVSHLIYRAFWWYNLTFFSYCTTGWTRSIFIVTLIQVCHKIFDFLSFYRFRRNVSAGLHFHCKIVTWMLLDLFLDLAATSSSLI